MLTRRVSKLTCEDAAKLLEGIRVSMAPAEVWITFFGPVRRLLGDRDEERTLVGDLGDRFETFERVFIGEERLRVRDPVASTMSFLLVCFDLESPDLVEDVPLRCL